jgi:hypothetical protein
VPASPIFICDERVLAGRIRGLLRRMPALSGKPIRIEGKPGLRDRHGEVHAGAFLRDRRIAFNCLAREFPRIFVHELFHFAWLRLGNARRRSYERLVADEGRRGARGELGWSAEWRKAELQERDRSGRSRRWREYCCESFCDTAAWLYARSGVHEEFTLGGRWRGRRRQWFAKVGANGLSI